MRPNNFFFLRCWQDRFLLQDSKGQCVLGLPPGSRRCGSPCLVSCFIQISACVFRWPPCLSSFPSLLKTPVTGLRAHLTSKMSPRSLTTYICRDPASNEVRFTGFGGPIWLPLLSASLKNPLWSLCGPRSQIKGGCTWGAALHEEHSGGSQEISTLGPHRGLQQPMREA